MKKNYEIENNIELVKINPNMFFLNSEGEKVHFTQRYLFGFKVNGKWVADVCKSKGGSNTPLVYNIEVAKEILKSGFVKSELHYCEEVGA